MGPVHFGEHTFIFDCFAGIPTSPENLAQRWWGGGGALFGAHVCIHMGYRLCRALKSGLVLNTLPSNEVK